MNIEDIKKRYHQHDKVYVEDSIDSGEAIGYLISLIEQAEKALQYYDTLYANIESNIQHGELITDWLKRQGETARTALKSIQGEG